MFSRIGIDISFSRNVASIIIFFKSDFFKPKNSTPSPTTIRRLETGKVDCPFPPRMLSDLLYYSTLCIFIKIPTLQFLVSLLFFVLWLKFKNFIRSIIGDYDYDHGVHQPEEDYFLASTPCIQKLK